MAEGDTFRVWFGFDTGSWQLDRLASRRIRLIGSQFDHRKYGTPLPVKGSGLQQASSPSRRVRIRARRPTDAAKLLNPSKVWSEKAKTAAYRAPRATRTGESAGWRGIRGIRGTVASGTLAEARGLDLAFDAGEYFDRLNQRRLLNQRVLATGRRGAAATRAIQSTAIPGRRGDAATRRAAAASPANAAVARPGQLPARQPAVTPQPGVAGMPQPTTGTAQLPRTLPDAAAQTFRDALARLGQQAGSLLNQALAPMAAPARAYALAPAPALAPVRAVPRAPGINAVPTGNPYGGPTRSPRLTPSLAPTVGYSTLTEPQPVPQEELAKCKCPPKEKKKSFACSNPLVSRSVKDGIITIKRKLQCQPSKPKLRSVPASPTRTSFPGLPSNIPGVGSS